jgi:Ulp1 family protease
MAEKSDCIDLTLSSENESNESNESSESSEFDCVDKELDNSKSFKCPFYPPLNISGNILGPRHFKILQNPSAWFNDDLINAFFCKLQIQTNLEMENEISVIAKKKKKIVALSSFFYESLMRRGEEYCMKHWTRDLKELRDDSFVFIPINSGGSHWVLVVWKVDSGVLEYFDSLMCKRTGYRIMKRLSEFFNLFIETFNDDEKEFDHDATDATDASNDNTSNTSKTSKTNKTNNTNNTNTTSFDVSDALLKLSISSSSSFEIPKIETLQIPKKQLQQTDGSSCGPFCCFNGKMILSANEDKTEIVPNVDIYAFRSSLVEYFKD